MLDVTYIAGDGRSGSTLVGEILGALPGTFMAGEMLNLFVARRLHATRCSCLEQAGNCPVWGSALGPDVDHLAERVRALADAKFRLRRLPSLLAGELSFTTTESGTLRDVGAILERLASSTGACHIVESSKSPTLAAMLHGIPGVRVRTVHVLRDPRAVALSWSKKKYVPELGHDMQQFTPLRAALRWSTWNLATPLLASRRKIPYHRLWLEDLVAQPRETLDALATFVGVDRSRFTVSANGEIAVRGDHVIVGNPIRFHQHATAKLSLDERWRLELPMSARVLVNAVTALPHLLLR